MNPEVNTTEQELSPEEAKASLGLSTRLTEQFLMSQVPQQPAEGTETQEFAPEEDLELETEETPPVGKEEPINEEPEPELEKDDVADKMVDMEKSMTEKLDQIRKELKEDNQREIDTLKKIIQDAIK